MSLPIHSQETGVLLRGMEEASPYFWPEEDKQEGLPWESVGHALRYP